jgi:hypothetical protein
MIAAFRGRLRTGLFVSLILLSGGARGGLALVADGAAIAPFTPGNLVVYRVGVPGGVNLVATGSPVFLDEYTPSGQLVQSIALPTMASGAQLALVASGTATSDGLLTRSADSSCLAVTGYGRDLFTATGTLNTAGGNLTSGTLTVGGSPIPRVVARVTASGAIDTTTALTDASTGTNFRGAASVDCTGFWVSGNAGGIRYATLGAATSADLTTANVPTLATARAVAIAGGQLYASSAVNALTGVGTIGTGTPTFGTQAIGKLQNTTTPSAYSFFLADLDANVPGFDTLYVADDGANGGGGLTKFALSGSSWSAINTIGVPGTGGDNYRGLTGVVTDVITGGVVTGKTVTLYATRKGGSGTAGGGELVALTDNGGRSGALIGTPTLLATAAAKTAFRGVALVPDRVILTPSAGANGHISPATPQAVAANTTRVFTVTADPGYSPVVSGCSGSLGIDRTTFTTGPASINCTITATFTLLPTFTVTPSAGANGSISPNTPRTLVQGTTASFTITPQPGYSFSVGGTCLGAISGNMFTLDLVVADCTVDATFTRITRTVTPSAGANGTINPGAAQIVPFGDRAVFVVAPAFGFSASVAGTCGGTLTVTTYTTNPITADCTVSASFTPLPTYSVTPLGGANSTVTPNAPVIVFSGQTASFTVMPLPGYSVAVRGTCGGVLSGDTFTTAPVTRDCTVVVAFARKLVLFVGNSFTHGRVDPVLSYNAANVTDLTYEMWLANPSNSNADEPHPWGGIPGVFKKLTDEAGLDYDVSISARSAATLRGHYLDLNPDGWDLRGNIASQRFDAVVLQDLSDEPLPANRGANANLPYFHTYVDKIEAWTHRGAAETYTESQLFGGSTAACQAITGASANTCDASRPVAPANGHAHADAQVFLYETWARPDMIGPNGDNARGQFYTAAEGLETMTADFHDAYFGRAAANPNIAGVAAVGDAFLRAVQDGVATRDPYVPEAGKIDLWHTDFFHPSRYGSYLSALVHFATITGLDPMTLGAGEQAAADLSISPAVAAALQRIARATVMPDTTPPVTTATVSVAANDQGWNTGSVAVTFAAADNAGGWGVSAVSYSLTGAQPGSGSVASGGSVTISSEGETTITYFATDVAGNTEAPRTLVIRIDATPPTFSVPLGSTPSPLSNATTAAFVFSASDAGSGVAGFQCSLDGSGFADCSPGAASYGGLADGGHTFSVRATDRAGNVDSTPATYTWTVDTTPPSFAVPRSQTLEATGPAGAMAIFDLPTIATDAGDGSDPVTCSGGPSGSIFPLGATTVTCVSTDRAGNSRSQAFNVAVSDTTPPAIEPHAGVTASATGGSAALVFYSPPATRDIVDGVGTATCSPESGSSFAVGRTAVTCQATDHANNAAAATVFEVFVAAPVGRFVVFSRNMTSLRAGATVVSGDVGANERRIAGQDADPDADEGDGDDVTVRIGAGATLLQASSRVVGDTVRLLNKASVYNVVDNFLLNRKGTVLGTRTSPMAVPFTTLPAFPTVTPGTQNVTVARNTTITLGAGSYGSVRVGAGATLVLAGGMYQMLSLDLSRSATVIFRAATEIRVKTELDSMAGAKLVPDPSIPGLSASQMVIYVEGLDEVCHHLDPDDDGDDIGPTSVHIGTGNVVQANIYALNGTVRLKAKTQATGAFIGVHVLIGVNVRLTLDSAFN